MTISIIVAASTNDVIGIAGDLPWQISEDLRRFKTITMGKPIVMGRRTWDSIGRPLPGRRNIVLSTRPDFRADGAEVARSLDEALALVADADEIMIIGGARVYEEALPHADRIYLTRVHATLDGDAFFPGIDAADWRVTQSEDFQHSDPAYTFQVLQRA